MKKRRAGRFNPKRKIVSVEHTSYDIENLEKKVGYGGNPEHKRNPGDFGLIPPYSPRPAKSLCDNISVFKRSEALGYLKEGIRKKMLSEREINGFPKNIWAVDNNGNPMEAQLEDSVRGRYHGYPMPTSDPFTKEVLRVWKTRSA